MGRQVVAQTGISQVGKNKKPLSSLSSIFFFFFVSFVGELVMRYDFSPIKKFCRGKVSYFKKKAFDFLVFCGPD